MIVENYWKMLSSIQTAGAVQGDYTDISGATRYVVDPSTARNMNNLQSSMGAIYGSSTATPMSYYDTTVADRINNNLVATIGIAINIARDVGGMTRMFTITGRNYGSDITIARVGITKYLDYGSGDKNYLLAEVDLAEPIFVPGGDHNFNILLAWDDKDVAQIQTN